MNKYITQIKQLSTDSKYTNWYVSIVQQALIRPQIQEGHNHHIVPRSFGLGGEHDPANLVKLTYREHFLVHLILPRQLKSKSLRRRMLGAIAVLCSGLLISQLGDRQRWFSRRFEQWRQTLMREGAFAITKDTIWINNGERSKRIPTDECTQYSERGWVIGRITFNRTPQIYITKNGERKRIYPELTQQYLSEGWVLGLPDTEKICVTNGTHNIYVLPNYIPDGYSVGSYQKTCSGRLWVTDGITELYLKSGQAIPDGWTQGRVNYNKNLPNNSGKIKITDGTVGKWILSSSPIPIGWEKGSPPNRKKGWKRKKSSSTRVPLTHDALIPDGQALV